MKKTALIIIDMQADPYRVLQKFIYSHTRGRSKFVYFHFFAASSIAKNLEDSS